MPNYEAFLRNLDTSDFSRDRELDELQDISNQTRETRLSLRMRSSSRADFPRSAREMAEDLRRSKSGQSPSR